ncbi:GGDEF domain-containing protein [Bacillus sp. FJAT-49736]|uniref:sensor domain-containing diguanylate cyclase n=1 Tax=Bacillus sp. FJAT-49736 TaxID=2833582 RepID=UPI001BC93B02|nr:GGDEF domain-containing protein [Bacillus sp. FJAT-49736]MBS4174539.1 GGDEF domain-containing protein [Bacillus sp. FJAT-49736]
MNIIDRIRNHPLIINSKPAKADMIAINNHRIYLLFSILMIIHLAQGIIFLIYNPGFKAEDNVYQWRMGIAISNFVMFGVVLIIGGTALWLKQKQLDKSKASSVLQLIAITAYFSFGIIVSAYGQLVNAGSNVFSSVCIGIAVIFLMNPVKALIFYCIAFFFFHFGISFTQHNNDILLSERVNSISVVGISFGIALISWRNSIYKIYQEKEIEKQNQMLEAQNKQLEFLATHDSLTGLFNRMEFMKCVEIEMTRMSRNNSNTCIILMDIDHFKHVNDQYGHPSGDKILKEVGILLSNLLDSKYLPARLGGEEFIFLLPETSLEEATEVAETIKSAIQSYMCTVENETIIVTASLGVASLNMEEADPFTSCYHRADIALYKAKNNGRNRVVCA